MEYDVAIIGGGVAGLTAAIYSGRRELKTVVFEEKLPGGQLNFTAMIENYPGFPVGILGPELGVKIKEQAERYGVEIRQEAVTAVKKDGMRFKVTAEGEYVAKAVIFATGTRRRELTIPGESRLKNRGITYCATCDGPLFKGKKVAVVGGGDSAVESALMMTKIASSVCLIHRRDKLRAEEIMQKRLFAQNVTPLWDTEVVEAFGEKMLEKIKVKNLKTGEEKELEIQGLLVEIGTLPQSKVAKECGIELAESKYIKANDRGETNVKGAYAAGDVTGVELQLGVAVSQGIIASKGAYHYICTECD